MKSLFLGISLFVTTCVFAQNPDHYITQKGLLWEVSGHDAAKVGYVYGTMHVPEKVAFNLSDSFFVALRYADIVALESDHGRWLDYSDSLNGMNFGTVFEKDVYRDDRYSNNFLYKSFNFESPEAELLGRLFSIKPLMTNEILNRSSEEGQDFEEDTYLDQFIFQCGKKLGKKVIGLETLEGNLEANIRAEMPDEGEEDEERNYYSRNNSGNGMSIIDAYRLQDLQLLDSIDHMSGQSKNHFKWIIDERNVIMAEGIDSILQSGQSIFAGVGASHLPGEMGVLHLLRLKGYIIRPVTFSDNGAKQEINVMLEKKHPVVFSKHWSSDSVWYAEVPGVFHKTRQYDFAEEQLCADMSNGSYYAVTRISTYGLWAGYTQDQIAQRIDSIIYEMVPGKIQDRTRLNSPMPGFDIKTKLRRGDIRRYRVFISPAEIFYFVVSGNGEYANGEEANQFLESIKFNPNMLVSKPTPTTIKPKFGGMTITFPASVQHNTTDDPEAQNYTASTFNPEDSTFYLVSRIAFQDTYYIEEDSFELNIFSEFIAEDFTDSLPTYSLVTAKKEPTQDFAFVSAKDSFQYHGRLIIDGPRYYLLGTRSKNPKRNDSFFNSFSLQPFVYPDGFVQHVDTIKNYSVRVLPTTIPYQSNVIKKLALVIKEVEVAIGRSQEKKGYGGTRGYVEEEKKYWEESMNSQLTDEKVSVSSKYLGGYFGSITYDSLIFLLKDTKKNNLILHSFEITKLLDGRMYVVDLVKTDTNSVRMIREKIIFTADRAYYLDVNTDVAGESEFVKQIFNSFTVLNIPNEPVAFGTVDVSFLKDIYHPDSLVRDEAWQTFQEFKFATLKDEHFDAFKAAINHPAFGQQKLEHKARIIRALQKFKKPEQRAYLESLFDRYRDSMIYHQTLVLTLANHQNTEAYNFLFKKIEANQLSLSAQFNVLEYMSDSLQLMAHYVNNLNRLSTYEAYAGSVRGVLNRLLSSDVIKPKAYKSLVPTLTQNFRIEAMKIKAERQRSLFNDQDKREANNLGSRSYESSGYSPANIGEGASNGLTNGTILLIPYIRQDQALKSEFEQLIKVASPQVKATLYAQMLKHSNPVPRTEIAEMAQVDSTRWIIFERLRDVNKLSAYNDLFTDTLSLARSYLYNQIKEIDSVRFISQHKAIVSNQNVNIYFFEIKRRESTKWLFADLTIHVSALAADPKKDIKNLSREQRQNYNSNSNKPYMSTKQFANEKEKQEYIEKRLKNLRFIGRERFRNNHNRESADILEALH